MKCIIHRRYRGIALPHLHLSILQSQILLYELRYAAQLMFVLILPDTDNGEDYSTCLYLRSKSRMQITNHVKFIAHLKNVSLPLPVDQRHQRTLHEM